MAVGLVTLSFMVRVTPGSGKDVGQRMVKGKDGGNGEGVGDEGLIRGVIRGVEGYSI